VAVAVTGSVAGDVSVTFSADEAFRIEPFPLGDPGPPDVRRLGPSSLLAAGGRIVPFTGRQPELARLRGWRDDGDDLSVLLVHGPGGQGKTRLAARCAEEAAADGWVVAQARHHTDPGPPTAHQEGVDGARGLLVVVDYAERWPRGHLDRLFRTPFLRQGVPVRLLLLARPAGSWWQSMRNPLTKLRATSADLELGPLADTVADRHRMFTAARNEFGSLLDAGRVTELEPAGSLTDDGYALALTLHMAALVAVDAHRRGVRPPDDPAELSAYLRDREWDHWATLRANGRVTVPERVMARLVGLATLTRPLPNPVAVTAVTGVRLAADDTAAQLLLDDHAVCYPPAEAGTALEPLAPDRLAEDHIADLLSGTDSWAWDLPGRLLLAGPDGTRPPYAAAALGTLVETARRWEHVRDHLYPLLLAHPELVELAVGAGLVTLAEYADPDVLAALEARLPRDTHVELDTGIAVLTRRLTEHGLAATEDEATRATLYNKLAVRSLYAGLYPEAVSAARQAVALRTRLAAADARHQADLAAALSNLAVALSQSGDAAGATDAAREAVTLRRRLARQNAAAYEPDLALSLANLSIHLTDLARDGLPDGEQDDRTDGEQDESAAVAEEAVAIYRRLAEAAPDTYLPDLARACANHGRALNALGDHRAGASAAREAVTLYRPLADAHPAAHEPELARSLVNLRVNLSALNEREEPFSLATEAVDIYRRVAAANPAVYAPELVQALSALGFHLVDHGRPEEALTVTHEAVDLCRDLAATDPVTHEPTLAATLSDLSTALREAGHLKQALAADQEAVDILRRLAPDGSRALSTALSRLSESLISVERRRHAVSALQEAIELHRRFSRNGVTLAGSLVVLSSVQSALQKNEEAVASLREAVGLFREAALREPVYRIDLAEALGELAGHLADAEDHEEAIAAAEEAVGVWRAETDGDPDAWQPLAECLALLGDSLIELGRWADALDRTVEQVAAVRRVAPPGEEVALALALALDREVALRADLDQHERALAPSREAVSYWRSLADSDPAAHEPQLAGALSTQAELLRAVGRRADALRAALEAEAMWATLAEEWPDSDLFTEELNDTTELLEELRTESASRKKHGEASPGRRRDEGARDDPPRP
jgi:hypothetical protein